MASFQRVEEIDAWKAARGLTREIYRVSAENSFRRDFALRDQIRKASISVMSNIAEGYERHRPGEFAHFLSIAKGSAGEIKAQLYVAVDVGHITREEFDDLFEQADHTAKLIYGLMSYLKQSRHANRPQPRADAPI